MSSTDNNTTPQDVEAKREALVRKLNTFVGLYRECADPAKKTACPSSNLGTGLGGTMKSDQSEVRTPKRKERPTTS